MINFHSKIIKSIIIAIFILSLTISIYIVPASAIVTGTVSGDNLSQLFSQENYNYYRIRHYLFWPIESSDPIYSNVYPSKTDFFSSVYSYESGYNFEYFGREIISSFPFDPIEQEYTDGMDYGSQKDLFLRFFMPVGIQGSTKITLQFIITETGSSSTDHSNFFNDISHDSIGTNKVTFHAVDNSGKSYNLKSSVYEYDGLTTLYLSSDGTGGARRSKVYDIEINNFDFLNYIYVTVTPDVAFNGRSLVFGVSKIYYEGANSQLTDIQASIDSLISEVLNSQDQQKELNDFLITVSPDGQLIIDDLKQDVKDSEDGLGEIIDVLDSVPKPDPGDLLPDQQVIMGQYMDSGGAEAVASVITPLFDEKGPIYIMLFAVLSVALISYVLYGKKA